MVLTVSSCEFCNEEIELQKSYTEPTFGYYQVQILTWIIPKVVGINHLILSHGNETTSQRVSNQFLESYPPRFFFL